MAIVRPFKGIRPEKKYAEKVASLPYDVMNREEAAKMAEGNSYSYLHISRSEIDLPEIENAYDAQVYKKAKSNLDSFLKKGILIQDSDPTLYIYSEVMDGRRQTGIVGTVSVDEYDQNLIKKHEFTRVEKEIDRINHFDACNANTEPVFLTYRENKQLTTLIEGYMSSKAPEYDFTAEGDVTHQLWVINDSSVVSSISELFKDVPALYIADGHHRTESACKISKKRREENPGYTGDEEFNFFMAAIFPDNELKIYDYNRVVKDLNGMDINEFFKKTEAAGFEIEELGTKAVYPSKKHEYTMFIEDKWYKLTATDKIIPEDVIGSLDVAILQDNLLNPLLGIGDPRTDKRIDFVGGIRGLEELEKRVCSDMKIAIAVYPVEIGDLLSVADSSLVMPPKSTWFEPKLESGLFAHQL